MLKNLTLRVGSEASELDGLLASRRALRRCLRAHGAVQQPVQQQRTASLSFPCQPAMRACNCMGQACTGTREPAQVHRRGGDPAPEQVERDDEQGGQAHRARHEREQVQQAVLHSTRG